MSEDQDTSMDQSILYVDVENLQEIAKQVLTSTIENWPESFPKPVTIKLYVKADQTDLWRIWASYNIPSIEVYCKGVQHYTVSGSKNSADIMLSLDAFADLIKGKTKFIAIMSDDSDFTSLFAAIKSELNSEEKTEIHFKWFMTDRQDTRSSMLTEFLPEKYLHIVNCSTSKSIVAAKKRKKRTISNNFSEDEKIAREIIKNSAVGSFRSSDLKKIIMQHFPECPLNKLDNASFGTQFAKTIFPFLEKYGVISQKSGKRARKYEITEDAKVKMV